MAANSFALYKRDKQQEIATTFNLQRQADIHQKALELWVNEPLKIRQKYIEMATLRKVKETPPPSSRINSDIYQLNFQYSNQMDSSFQRMAEIESSNLQSSYYPTTGVPGSVSPDVLFATQLDEAPNSLQSYFDAPLEESIKSNFGFSNPTHQFAFTGDAYGNTHFLSGSAIDNNNAKARS